ncbi:hypothetical protein VNO78_04157 [Psophocarpus tetragonolobus]|uniref:Uncharacterized protein n=1 Tax=Psophocarpus tetragonolobus TaxID=3891 RepID=A0AAN9T268_PSOTE
MKMGRRYAKWRRIVQQQRGKLYIMRICISMLLNWHKAWTDGDSMTETTLTSKIPFKPHIPTTNYNKFQGAKHLCRLAFYCMAGHFLSWRFPKLQLWKRFTRLFREQKTKFYIIWTCIVILLRWKER